MASAGRPSVMVSAPVNADVNPLANYELCDTLGSGTYGTVTMARCKDASQKPVAIKEIASTEEGVCVSAIREASLLMQLKGHPNIVSLLEVRSGPKATYLVLEYVDDTLSNRVGKLTRTEVRSYMWQMLAGLAHCHRFGVLHRDLKPANVLLDRYGGLKLADFGIGRQVSTGRRAYTTEVATIWYRAPELLLGCQHYDGAIDMWSLGCVFAEMVTGQPLFRGNSDTHQLVLITDCLGTPTTDAWARLRVNVRLNSKPRGSWGPAVEQGLCTDGLALLSRLAHVDYGCRPPVGDALEHAYFTATE